MKNFLARLLFTQPVVVSKGFLSSLEEVEKTHTDVQLQMWVWLVIGFVAFQVVRGCLLPRNDKQASLPQPTIEYIGEDFITFSITPYPTRSDDE